MPDNVCLTFALFCHQEDEVILGGMENALPEVEDAEKDDIEALGKLTREMLQVTLKRN